jgi:ankyrin repeat protein
VFIENRDTHGLQLFLDHSHVPITDIKDKRGYSLLHMASYKDFDDVLLALLNRAKKQYTA